MKNCQIKNCAVYKLQIPLIMPFTISSGSHKRLDNLIFEIELSGGEKGFGEAPVATHITGETIEGTKNNLKKFAAFIEGRDISNYMSLFVLAEEFFEKNRAALFAAQTAIYDAFLKSLNMPLWKMYGNKPKKVQSDITIVIGDDRQAFDFALKMRERGFRIFKIKTGLDFDMDIKRILAVKKAAKNPDIYIDANCAYSADSAFKFLKELEKRGVRPAVVEQPVKKDDFEGLKYLSGKFSFPVCADESAYSLNDVFQLVKKKACTAINIKLTKLGFLRAMEVKRLADASNMRLMMGQMMESQLATFAALHFSQGLGGFDFIDLDTPHFLAGNFLKYDKKIISSSGFYDISAVKKGIGAWPDIKKVQKEVV